MCWERTAPFDEPCGLILTKRCTPSAILREPHKAQQYCDNLPWHEVLRWPLVGSSQRLERILASYFNLSKYVVTLLADGGMDEEEAYTWLMEKSTNVTSITFFIVPAPNPKKIENWALTQSGMG